MSLQGTRMQRDTTAFLANKKILVTGASGFIGSNFIRRLSGKSCQVVSLNHSGASMANFQDKKVWGDCLSGIDYVFHFAAQTSVPLAEANPEADFRANVLPILLMLETCRTQKLSPTVLLAGTATTIGNPQASVVNESLPDQPVTVYDLHKLVGEQYLKYYIGQGVLRGASLRLFNVYGPGPNSSTTSRGILNQMIRKAIAGEELPLFGKGEPVRDYIYIDDVVEAFFAAAEHVQSINGSHFYIGTGRGTSLAQAFDMIAHQCERKTGRKVSVRPMTQTSPGSPIEARRYVADARRFGELTGWKPTVSLEEGIDRTIDYFASL